MSIPIISGPYRTFRDLNPGETYIEYEGSTITIPIRARLRGGRVMEERLKLTAFMRLEVFPAYVNRLGTREFQFIIRDWELLGYSALLNDLFMGHPGGYLAKGANPREGREPAVVTFTLSRHYEKYGDDSNMILASASALRIEDLTSHDVHNNDLFWEVDHDPKNKGKFCVHFHKKRPEGDHYEAFKADDDFDDLVATAENVGAGESFVASYPSKHNRVFSRGNTVLRAGQKLHFPMTVHWRLGSNPAPSRGKVHMMSPPKSLCIADQGPAAGRPADSADFPARIIYSASYDIFINDVPLVRDQAGVAVAVGVTAIPPVDVKVAFQKPFSMQISGKLSGESAGDAKIKPPSASLSGSILEFDEGDCTGMEEIETIRYQEGKQTAAYYRSCRLDTQRGRKPSPPPLNM